MKMAKIKFALAGVVVSGLTTMGTPGHALEPTIDETSCSLSVSGQTNIYDAGLNSNPYRLTGGQYAIGDMVSSQLQVVRPDLGDMAVLSRVTHYDGGPGYTRYFTFSLLSLNSGKEKIPYVKLPATLINPAIFARLGDKFVVLTKLFLTTNKVPENRLYVLDAAGKVLAERRISAFFADTFDAKDGKIVAAGRACPTRAYPCSADDGIAFQVFDSLLNPISAAITVPVTKDPRATEILNSIAIQDGIIALAHTGSISLGQIGTTSWGVIRNPQLTTVRMDGSVVNHHLFPDHQDRLPNQSISLDKADVAFSGGRLLYCAAVWGSFGVPRLPIRCRLFDEIGTDLSEGRFDASPLVPTANFDLRSIGQGFMLTWPSKAGTSSLSDNVANFSIVDRGGHPRLNSIVSLRTSVTNSVDYTLSEQFGNGQWATTNQFWRANYRAYYGVNYRKITCQ